MNPTIRLVALAGSLRTGSYNKALVKIAANGARAAGAEVTYVDLRDDPLPLFDEDLERAQGMPAAAARLKQLFIDSDGFLLAAPEYNSSITAVLKNAIDWMSRAAPDEAPLRAFRGKWAALLSASPGALGGLRGLVHVRAILGNIGVYLLPEQVAVMRAHEAFTDDGRLRDEKLHAAAEGLGRSLTRALQALRHGEAARV